jgi:hypothetical protein
LRAAGGVVGHHRNMAFEATFVDYARGKGCGYLDEDM